MVGASTALSPLFRERSFIEGYRQPTGMVRLVWVAALSGAVFHLGASPVLYVWGYDGVAALSGAVFH